MYIKTLLTLAIILCQAPSLPAKASANGFAKAIDNFQLHGFQVLRDNPRCAERSLFGLYIRGKREIVVCRKGNELNTLLHEGWHGVQAMCLHGAPWLTNEQLQKGLGRQDQRELALLYKPSQRRREAEARLMANQPIETYFKVMDQACGVLPQPGLKTTTAAP